MHLSLPLLTIASLLNKSRLRYNINNMFHSVSHTNHSHIESSVACDVIKVESHYISFLTISSEINQQDIRKERNLSRQSVQDIIHVFR